MEIALPERHVTEGDYADEATCVSELSDVLDLSGAFTVYPEVCGYTTVAAPGKERKDLRIDMILAPKPRLMEQGWQHGMVGIECKRSGSEFQRVAAQARDYRFAMFELRKPGGPLLADVALRWVFIYPQELPGGDLESLLASDGVGVAHLRKTFPGGVRYLRFKVGGYKLLEIYADGSRPLVNERPTPGRKVGSR